MIEIFTIGGYSEVGKNMTAIKVDDEIVILDMGLYMPKLVEYEDEDPYSLSAERLARLKIIPDDRILNEYRKNVKAIVLGHAHLDHIGAIPYLADKYYKCPIIGTPYTIEVLKSLIEERKIKLKGELKKLNVNSTIKISEKIKIEFINMTHSTIQTVLIAIHTPEGTILYANDFKFDNHPIVGKKPDYKRLRELKGKIFALIVDSLYSYLDRKTPSEKVARELLKDVLLGTDNKGHALVVTTFSSHISRLKSIIDFGKILKRRIVFLGRSLHKYVSCAEKIGIVNFSKDVELIGFAKKVRKKLKEIEKDGRSNYMIVCTGNQGETRSVLTRMTNKELPWEFLPGDHVVFSCSTVPTQQTVANRATLERKLKQKNVRIFKEIHVSGHASREDLRDLIEMVKPKHIIPAHGESSKQKPLADLAVDLGYKIGENVHLTKDGDILRLN